MGFRLAYPDVPPPTIHEIYKKSLRQPIHAYAFFVDLPDLYSRIRGPLDAIDPSISVMDDMAKVIWHVRSKLIATGLHKLSIASIPIPKQRRTIYSGDVGWLVVLGTRFDKAPHVPVSDELTQRVRTIICAKDEPAWWKMRKFSYPHPTLWLQHEENKKPVIEG
ncbi:unnamed protein product [Rhizoctonia solani]|uniref:Uncharacterized protein n=1 Tax=Rhizoctonia solani TaxID=456999 RepID=A0A8H3GED2_9AGAM|nr:unnamed protein product [Rhizoctonia solani]